MSFGADVNAKDDDGQTPLAIACQRRNIHGVEALLQAGAVLQAGAEQIDVNATDNQQSTPLHEACEDGSDVIVEKLIVNGAKISVANKEEVTPLHIACSGGHDKVVNILLLRGHTEKDKLVRAIDNQGNTALHYAVESGTESIVQVLLLAGANPIAQKHNKVTPLHIAARSGHIGIAALLLQYRDQSNAEFDIIEMIDREQNTPLHFAARHDQCKMIRYLVQK